MTVSRRRPVTRLVDRLRDLEQHKVQVRLRHLAQADGLLVQVEAVKAAAAAAAVTQ